MASSSTTTPDTLVTLKINIEGANKRIKLPLRDLGASTLPEKLRALLAIPPTSEAIFERYSDSAATFVTLDPNNASVYKQLYRAAKAKLKLRLKVTVINKAHVVPKPATVEDEQPATVSPVEEKPLLQSEKEHEKLHPASVCEIQRGFEKLLLNHRLSAPVATQPSMGFTGRCTRNDFGASAGASRCPAMAAQSSTEVPVTSGPSARENWYAELSSRDSTHAKIHCPVSPLVSVYSVYCNNCNDSIPDAHYHCSTCDDGDFDLCQSCVDDGVLCGSEDHWLIKRFVKNGKVINSTTETIAPRPAFSESKTTLVTPEKVPEATRTCNNCIIELAEHYFVTCTTCPDFDLCITCHTAGKHGHHPKHAFTPAFEDTRLDVVAKALLAPGRNVAHNAICDGCDKYIYGVRHKCLDCPDWDFCSACIANAGFIHPSHRFVPIYDPLNDLAYITKSYRTKSRHHGIYCDGPLCNVNSPQPQSYITGDRYKCAVCHDTDFCASCEASPTNSHNRTHPLIKFKTPVRNVSVTTLGDREDGRSMPVMGDRRTCTRSKATETTPSPSANAATQVRTVADLQPQPIKEEKIEPVKEQVDIKTEAMELPAAAKEGLVAHFVRDAIADGTVLQANTVFEQTWYLRNGGNTAWPAGCSVKFVGGDNMCAVDPEHPVSVHELVSAAESTICYTEVAPGQETGFTVLMRTPNRTGNFVSYWRLTGADGEKFGHRLWCDVNVKEVPVAVKEEPKVEGSQMIFPKLEKESPTTSVYQQAAAVSEAEYEVDDFDDFADEPLEDEETEDGFFTDEEYDILDASDEEYLAEQAKVTKK